MLRRTPIEILLTFFACATMALPVAAQPLLDAASSEVAPSVFALAKPDGGIEVAWRRADGRIVFSTFTDHDYQTGRHLPLETDLQLLGGFASDDNGNRYIAVLKDEKATPLEWAAKHRSGIAQVMRIPPTGDRNQVLADVGLPEFSGKWPLINPIRLADGGTTNSELVYNPKSGLLALAFGHNNGAPDNIHQTGALIGLSTDGAARYNVGGGQHCIQECLAVDGDAIVMAQVFDQGIGLSRLSRSGDRWTWSDFVLVYEIKRSNQAEESLVLAGIVPGPAGYSIVFSAGKGWLWRQRSFDHGLDGGCEIKLLQVARNFEATLPKFSWPDNVHQQGNFPIITLARPDANRSYVRPVIAPLAGSEAIVAFEEWRKPNRADAPELNGIKAVRFNAAGDILATSPVIAKYRIPRSTRAFTFPDGKSIGWVSGDAPGKRLLLHTFDAQLNHLPYELGRGRLSPPGFNFRLTNSGKHPVQIDVTIPSGSPGKKVTVAAGESQVIQDLANLTQLYVVSGSKSRTYTIEGSDLNVQAIGDAPPPMVNLAPNPLPNPLPNTVPGPMPIPARKFAIVVKNQTAERVAVYVENVRIGEVPAGQSKDFDRHPDGTAITVSDGTRAERWMVQGQDLTAVFAPKSGTAPQPAPNPAPQPAGNGFSLEVQNTSPENIAVRVNGKNFGAVAFGESRKFTERFPAGTAVTITDGATTKEYAVKGDLVIRWDPSGSAPANANIPGGQLRVEQLAGRYVRDNPNDDFHEGVITIAGAGRNRTISWKNKAGVEWSLAPDLARGALLTDEQNPYFKDQPDIGRKFLIVQPKNADGSLRPEVTGFYFLNEFYRRKN